jgi:hypothetical protein
MQSDDLKQRTQARILRQRLLARNGTNSALARILASMSDSEVVESYQKFTADQVQAQGVAAN